MKGFQLISDKKQRCRVRQEEPGEQSSHLYPRFRFHFQRKTFPFFRGGNRCAENFSVLVRKLKTLDLNPETAEAELGSVGLTFLNTSNQARWWGWTPFPRGLQEAGKSLLCCQPLPRQPRSGWESREMGETVSSSIGSLPVTPQTFRRVFNNPSPE